MNFDVKMKTYILFTLFYFFGAKAESSNETFGNSYKEIKNYFNSYFIYHFISGSNHGGLWGVRHRCWKDCRIVSSEIQAIVQTSWIAYWKAWPFKWRSSSLWWGLSWRHAGGRHHLCAVEPRHRHLGQVSHLVHGSWWLPWLPRLMDSRQYKHQWNISYGRTTWQ